MCGPSDRMIHGLGKPLHFHQERVEPFHIDSTQAHGRKRDMSGSPYPLNLEFTLSQPSKTETRLFNTDGFSPPALE